MREKISQKLRCGIMGHYANLTFKVQMFLEVVFGKMLHYPNVCIFSLFLYIFLFDFMVYVCVCACGGGGRNDN